MVLGPNAAGQNVAEKTINAFRRRFGFTNIYTFTE